MSLNFPFVCPSRSPRLIYLLSAPAKVPHNFIHDLDLNNSNFDDNSRGANLIVHDNPAFWYSNIQHVKQLKMCRAGTLFYNIFRGIDGAIKFQTVIFVKSTKFQQLMYGWFLQEKKIQIFSLACWKLQVSWMSNSYVLMRTKALSFGFNLQLTAFLAFYFLT